MERCWRGWLAGLAIACMAAPAGAASTRTTAFRVGAVVIAICRVTPGQSSACAPSPGSTAPRPAVRFSRDARTRAIIETIEF
jgi:hypothetical protein